MENFMKDYVPRQNLQFFTVYVKTVIAEGDCLPVADVLKRIIFCYGIFMSICYVIRSCTVD